MPGTLAEHRTTTAASLQGRETPYENLLASSKRPPRKMEVEPPTLAHIDGLALCQATIMAQKLTWSWQVKKVQPSPERLVQQIHI